MVCKISFINQKGGVGKTTSTINVACNLSRLGKNCLIIDLDHQAHASLGLGLKELNGNLGSKNLLIGKVPIEETFCKVRDHLYICPADIKLSSVEMKLYLSAGREYILFKKLKEIENRFDFILFDCPPSLGNITMNSIVASDYLIIPIQTHQWSLEGLSNLLDTVDYINRDINSIIDRKVEILGILVTMINRSLKLTNTMHKTLYEYFGDKLFKTSIPTNSKILESQVECTDIESYDSKSRGAKAYKNLTDEIIERLKNG